MEDGGDPMPLDLPRSLLPHPSFGHLLPRGEGGEVAPHESSVRIGLLQLVL
jgi:hypothetical protein